MIMLTRASERIFNPSRYKVFRHSKPKLVLYSKQTMRLAAISANRMVCLLQVVDYKVQVSVYPVETPYTVFYVYGTKHVWSGAWPI